MDKIPLENNKYDEIEILNKVFSTMTLTIKFSNTEIYLIWRIEIDLHGDTRHGITRSRFCVLNYGNKI